MARCGPGPPDEKDLQERNFDQKKITYAPLHP